ncbi:MAG: hypothetical protein ACLRIO_07395, partial [Butyricicoccus sp.]
IGIAKTVSAFSGASVIKYSSFDMIIFLHNFRLFIGKYEHSKCDRYNVLADCPGCQDHTRQI